jgi:hypothetical protein
MQQVCDRVFRPAVYCRSWCVCAVNAVLPCLDWHVCSVLVVTNSTMCCSAGFCDWLKDCQAVDNCIAVELLVCLKLAATQHFGRGIFQLVSGKAKHSVP